MIETSITDFLFSTNCFSNVVSIKELSTHYITMIFLNLSGAWLSKLTNYANTVHLNRITPSTLLFT